MANDGSRRRTTTHLDRRTFLQAAIGAGVAAAAGAETTGTASATGEVSWFFETGDSVDSSPTVVDGTVYVGSNDGNVYAVDAGSGDAEWQFETGGLVRSSPTVVGDTLFVGSTDGNVYAVAAESGSEGWRFETAGVVKSSPTVVDGTVYIGSNDGNVYALDAELGEQQWVVGTGERVESSPVVVDETVYVGSFDNSLYALDASSGEEEWAVEVGDSVFSSPTVVEGTVYVGSNDGNVYALDAGSGEEGWAFGAGDGVFSSPTVADGTVYVGNNGGTLYAVDEESGEQQWTFEVGDRVDSSPTVAGGGSSDGGTVFVGSGDDNVYAVDGESGEEMWTFESGDTVFSSPIVVDGTVYVGSGDGDVYALDAGVSGSSHGSRALLGTLGHHDDWQYAGQTIDLPEEGFLTRNRMYAVAAGGAATLLGGYALLRRRGGDSSAPENERQRPQEEPFSPTVASPKWTDSDDDDSPTPGMLLDEHLDRVETLRRDANRARKKGNYESALEACKEAIFAAQDAREIAESEVEGRVSDAEAVLKDAREFTREIKTEREARETLTAHLPDIGDRLDAADEKIDAGRYGDCLTQTETIREAIADAKEPAESYGFEEFIDRLGEFEERCDWIRDRAQHERDTARQRPETIPSPPALSLSYADLETGLPLATGHNADIYHCTTTADGETLDLVLKEPRLKGTTDNTDAAPMLEAVEQWEQLDDHDHIVSVVDSGSDPHPWICMEYMDGGNLEELMDGLGYERAIWTAVAVTEAVEHGHDNGVLHLALKPENILFRSVEESDGVPKVSDWVISKHLAHHPRSTGGMSVDYAAPEQFDEERGPADEQTDVYQLGAVFYELLTGQPPFEGKQFQVMQKIRSEQPTPPSDLADVPEELDEVLLTALAKEKTDRYETVRDMRNALNRLVS